MSNEPTKITIDLASIVSLKAEVLKKQEEYRFRKRAKQDEILGNEYESNPTSSTWGKKTIEKDSKKEATYDHLTTKDADNKEQEDSMDEFEKSRKMLESKAKYYEQITSGQQIDDEADDETFLVDFSLKYQEDRDLKKKLGLKKIVSEDLYNEELRTKWERESFENRDKDSVHYQDIRYDEIRNMGVGNFQFSRNPAERQKQMEFFNEMQSETKLNRANDEIYKLKRERDLKIRLMKIKQRRLLKYGFSLDEIKLEMSVEFEVDIEEMNKELIQLENYATQQRLLDNSEKKRKLDDDNESEFLKTMKKKINLDREWDKPKLKEKYWEKHVENLRKERNKQFAPPKLYAKEKYTKKESRAKKSFHERPAEEFNNPQFYNTLLPNPNSFTTIQNVPPPFIIPQMNIPHPFIPPLFGVQVPPPNFSQLYQSDNSPQTPYNDQTNGFDNEVCILGTSMVKHIKPSDLFNEKKCYFKSISGGSIINIINLIKTDENKMKDIKLFVITCGSNDLDSTFKTVQRTIEIYLDLGRTLKSLFPNAKFFFNTLIPRSTTRYISLDEFEERRTSLNRFMEQNLPTLVSSTLIVKHPTFENSNILNNLLYDGVHLSAKGVALYTEEIKNVLVNFL